MSENIFDSLTEKVKDFSQLRDWEKFHTPKNLAMAIAGEAGELVAEFQWLTSEESSRNELSADRLEAIRLEIADIQIYLLRLADQLQIEVPKAVLDKLAINEERFKI